MIPAEGTSGPTRGDDAGLLFTGEMYGVQLDHLTAVIRVVGHPARQIAGLPYARMRSHQVVIGTTGTGNPAPAPSITSLRRRIGFLGRIIHLAGILSGRVGS